MLGTFYPLDIKGDTRGVLSQIEKSMLRHTHLKFHFRRTTFSKGGKKAIANKNDYRTGGFTKLEQRTGCCSPAQAVNKSGCALRLFPPRPLQQASPAQGWPQAEPRAHGPSCLLFPLPNLATTPCLHPVLKPPEAAPLSPSPPTPTTYHSWLRTKWETPEIVRPLLFPPGLYHLTEGCSESPRSGVKVKGSKEWDRPDSTEMLSVSLRWQPSPPPPSEEVSGS